MPKKKNWEGNPQLKTLLIPVEDLNLDPRNVRVHDEKNKRAINSSLAEFGQQKPIVVRKDGTIVAGNGTYGEALGLGWTHIAAVQFNGSDVSASRFGVADNRTAELAEWDVDNLSHLLSEFMQEEGFTADGLGFSEAEVLSLVADSEKLMAEVGAGYDTDSKPEYELPEPSAPDAAAPTLEPTSAGTGTSSESSGVDPIPVSSVRMVQVFLDDESHQKFMGWLKELSGDYGTDNVTDTIYKAVEVAKAVSEKRNEQAA